MMLALLRAFTVLTMLLACVGMMAVFLGGGGYLAALLLLLLLSLPFNTVLFFGSMIAFARRHGWRRGWNAMWRHVPRWTVIALALVLALMACGELALYLTLLLDETAPAFWQHLPLLAGTVAAFAFCALEAVRVTGAENAK